MRLFFKLVQYSIVQYSQDCIVQYNIYRLQCTVKKHGITMLLSRPLSTRHETLLLLFVEKRLPSPFLSQQALTQSSTAQDLLRVGGLLFGDPVSIADGAGGALQLPGSGALMASFRALMSCCSSLVGVLLCDLHAKHSVKPVQVTMNLKKHSIPQHTSTTNYCK